MSLEFISKLQTWVLSPAELELKVWAFHSTPSLGLYFLVESKVLNVLSGLKQGPHPHILCFKRNSDFCPDSYFDNHSSF